VLPIYAYGDQDVFAGAIGVRLGRRSGIEELGRISHPRSEGVIRSVVVGDSLYTVSHAGVDERGVRDFERRGWAEFPIGSAR
jgi:hypothetical protein